MQDFTSFVFFVSCCSCGGAHCLHNREFVGLIDCKRITSVELMLLSNFLCSSPWKLPDSNCGNSVLTAYIK
mgnify:CR=1 FL=1